MTWTSPRTWTAGEVVTAAIGNTHWRDDLNYLYGGAAGRMPSVNVFATGLTTSIATGSFTAVTSGLTVGEDTDSGWNAATGTYTIQTAGMWTLKFFMSWAANAAGSRSVFLNGTSLSYVSSMLSSNDPNNLGRLTLTIHDRFTAGATIQPQVFQNSGGALNLTTYALTARMVGG